MTPAQIISIVKDLAILIAIGVVAWFLVSYGKDIVKVADMKAVEKQLASNADQVAKWQQERTDADTKRDQAIATVGASIDAQRTPVFVCRSPSPSAVPSPASKASPGPASSGGDDSAARGNPIDIRPLINAYEKDTERYIAGCQSVLDQWPTANEVTHGRP